ncbi:MAG: rane fusion protein multidrug efflux system [Rhodospirillaceae bacterium]|nr:rane fusion protein multidrug efflux system [Rhodospirillaceae bacterium]
MANRNQFRRLGLADEVAAPALTPALAKLRHPKTLRRVLLTAGPVLVLAGALFVYATGGRYISTDDAYVHAGKLTVATDVSGIVANVAVKESQQVDKGQVLFTLDQEPFQIALAGAQANLGTVRNQLTTLQATYRQKQAQIEQVKTDVAFFETTFQRQQDLLKRGVASQAAYDQARRDLDSARQKVTMAQSDAQATLAQLGGNADAPIEQNPNYLAAQAQVDKAQRDLRRTTVLAPIPGIVTNVDALQVGEYLPAAQAAFSLVSSADVWVEANPKESDLTYLKPGAPAVVTIDAYPGREWQATVTSLRPATGTEFSVLPAQNATGNWVKVVQRVPIRLAVQMPADAPPLRTGMSATVEIDTGHRRVLGDVLASAWQFVGM